MSHRNVLPKNLSCSSTHSNPCFLQNMSVHYNFHHSLTHTLSPNFFSAPIFCSHIFSSLNITITAHMFSALQTPCWHTKMGDNESKTLTNHRTCQFITISTTVWLTPSHLISLAHLSSVLTYILHWTTSLLQPICLVHFKRHVDRPKWGIKKVRHWQITEPLT